MPSARGSRRPDGLGRRISIASTPAGGGTPTLTGYVWCGQQLCQAESSAGSVSREYEPEGEFLPGSPGQGLYYAPDQLGSVRRVFSSASAPAYDYDPYGVALQTTAPVTDFDYAGTFYNPDSGLYLAKRRPYDPVSGRWLTRDPMDDPASPLINLYAYAGDPLDSVDPDGLWPFGLPGQQAATQQIQQALQGQGLPPSQAASIAKDMTNQAGYGDIGTANAMLGAARKGQIPSPSEQKLIQNFIQRLPPQDQGPLENLFRKYCPQPSPKPSPKPAISIGPIYP